MALVFYRPIYTTFHGGSKNGNGPSLNMNTRIIALIKSAVLNLSLLMVSVIATYALGEIVVRVWMPQPMLPRYVTDAPYGIRNNMPNMSIWHSSSDYRVNVRTNSHGVRNDRDIPYEKTPGTFRIVGLGDSFALGYEVEQEDTYLYQLEKQLHDRGFTQVEVINLGVSGFGTSEELITLREEGFKYNPDLVLLGYFVNDIDNNVMSNLYSLKGDTLQREAATYLPAVELRKRLYATPGYRYLADNSQLLNLFRNYLSYMIQQNLARQNRQKEQKSDDRNNRGALEAAMALAQYEAKLTARLLDEIYISCEQRGVPFLLMNIPTTETKTNSIFSNIPIDHMRHMDKILYLDTQKIVGPYLGQRPIQWEKWHGHWRPWVHHLVAETLADMVADDLTHATPQNDQTLVSRSQNP